MKIIELKPGWCVRVPSYLNEHDAFWHLARNRFDPVTLAVAIGATAGSTAMQAHAQRQQGKAAKKLAYATAAAKEEEAKDARIESEAEAKNLEEKRRRIVATQKAGYAASNVKINVGAPLVIEAKTNADIARDKGYMLETGRRRADALRTEGFYEKEYGKEQKRQSNWAMMSTILSGAGDAAMMGYDAGMFSKKPKFPYKKKTDEWLTMPY